MRFPFRGPGGDRSINAAIFIGIGVWFWIDGVRNHSRVGSLMASGLIVLGVGLWVAYSWVRWPSALVLVSLAAFNFFMMPKRGFSWFSLIANLAVVWVAWTVIRDKGAEKKEAKLPEKDEDPPLVSIVLFLREPRSMDLTVLAGQISRAWGAECFARVDGGPPPPETNLRKARVVSGETPMFVVLDPAGIFLVHNQQRPYFPDAEGAAAPVPEARAREAVRTHKAWIAVDLKVPTAPAGPIESYYPQIARLVAELADEDCLGVFHPASLRMSAWDPALEDVLRRPDPLKTFTVPMEPTSPGPAAHEVQGRR